MFGLRRPRGTPLGTEARGVAINMPPIVNGLTHEERFPQPPSEHLYSSVRGEEDEDRLDEEVDDLYPRRTSKGKGIPGRPNLVK